MKKLFWGWLALIFFTLTNITNAQNKSEVILYDVRKASGIREVFSVAEKTALKTPEWFPDKEKTIPLTVNSAMIIAKEWVKKQYPNLEGFAVNSIKIGRINWPELTNRWYYLVEFSRLVKGYGSAGEYLFVVVLMDGTVIKSKRGE